jgi:succinate dehydrogenase hydrophobic anchor subunit
VVADARALARGSTERRLMTITGAACIALVIAGHLAITAVTSSANLAQWSSTTNQIVALEETP